MSHPLVVLLRGNWLLVGAQGALCTNFSGASKTFLHNPGQAQVGNEKRGKKHRQSDFHQHPPCPSARRQDLEESG